MTPYEIMLSESQERMLLVVKRGREAEVERIFDKWDLHAVHIGEVTGDGLLRVKNRGEVVAEIPNRALTDEAPVYRRPMAEPEYLAEVRQLDVRDAGLPAPSPNDALLMLLGVADHCAASGGSTGSTTTWCGRTRSTCPAWAPASSASRAPIARWRCRSMATAGTATSTRTAARCSPSPKRRATWRAPAAGRSAPPTA